jgi:hypothetical protein
MAISATAPRCAFDYIETENTRFVRMIVEIIRPTIDQQAGKYHDQASLTIPSAAIRPDQTRTSSAIVALLEHFTIRLTISGIGEICRALSRGEIREVGADDRPQILENVRPSCARQP